MPPKTERGGREAYHATGGLHLAAQDGDVAALKSLLSEGTPVDQVSEIHYVQDEAGVFIADPWLETVRAGASGAARFDAG